MDEDLKQHLETMEARLNRGFESRLDEAFTRFSQHILYEVGSRFDEVGKRLESMDGRLKLQAGLIQSGARAMVRFSEFSESSEERWVALVDRVATIERKLEGR